ncbi:MAG: type II toxin-antitoxin system HicB family antitoxin [Bacteroidetes bacterium]|nr:MAG: type II toxin-antitoxin system HicB family antitoxin [Bacteroidota bacterium]
MKYLVVFEKTQTGFSAYLPDMAGVVASGSTKEIAEKNIFDAITFHLEGLKEENMPFPQSQSESEIMCLAI